MLAACILAVLSISRGNTIALRPNQPNPTTESTTLPNPSLTGLPHLSQQYHPPPPRSNAPSPQRKRNL